MTHTLNGSFMTKRHILDKKPPKICLVCISYGLILLGAATYIQSNRKVTSASPPSSNYASVPKILVVMTQLLENLYLVDLEKCEEIVSPLLIL